MVSMVEPVSTSQEINELSEKLQMLDGSIYPW